MKLYEQAKLVNDYRPAKPNVNILFYVDTNYKEYHKIVRILDNLEINYVPIRIHERMVNREFIEMLLDYSERGFDDIVRTSFVRMLYPDAVYEDLTTSQMIKMIEENYVDLLKQAIFVGSNGVLTTSSIEFDYQQYKGE